MYLCGGGRKRFCCCPQGIKILHITLPFLSYQDQVHGLVGVESRLPQKGKFFEVLCEIITVKTFMLEEQ